MRYLIPSLALLFASTLPLPALAADAEAADAPVGAAVAVSALELTLRAIHEVGPPLWIDFSPALFNSQMQSLSALSGLELSPFRAVIPAPSVPTLGF